LNDQEVVPEPKKYPVYLQTSSKNDAIMEHYFGMSEPGFKGRIEGLIFKGLNTTTDVTTYCGGLNAIYSSTSPDSYLRVKDCVFENITGTMAGAAFVADKVFFDNCVFYNNKSTGTGSVSASAELIAQ